MPPDVHIRPSKLSSGRTQIDLQRPTKHKLGGPLQVYSICVPPNDNCVRQDVYGRMITSGECVSFNESLREARILSLLNVLFKLPSFFNGFKI